MIEDNFIPIPDFMSRFEYFTSIYKPAENHPESAPSEADEYESWRKGIVAKAVNVHYEKPSGHGISYKIAPVYSNTKKPLYRPTLKLEFQGKFVAAAIRYPSDRKYSRAKRGFVTDFSPGSRRRMFDMFHRLEIKTKPIFITLTYGDDYVDTKKAKNNLRAFFERIRRKYPSASGIWRMEFQERGAVHFHIIFFNLPFWKKEKVQQTWCEIIGDATNSTFTRIERIKSHRGVMYYVSKYIAKVNPGEDSGFNSLTYLHAYRAKYGDHIGRVWGKFECANLPFAELLTLERDFVPASFYQFRSLVETFLPQIKDYLSPGFRFYVKDAVRWSEIARHFFDPPSTMPLTI
jgi:hypothetical protein